MLDLDDYKSVFISFINAPVLDYLNDRLFCIMNNLRKFIFDFPKKKAHTVFYQFQMTLKEYFSVNFDILLLAKYGKEKT